MVTSFVLCDVFAGEPFSGNQLAVFLDAESLSDERMAELTREFGWSECTFISIDDGEARVRIWTPQAELPFAGHPTVGTAVVLAATGRIEIGWSTLHLAIGPTPVEVIRADSTGGEAVMTQLAPDFGAVYKESGALAAGLGLDEADLVPELPIQMVSTGLAHLMCPVRSQSALARAHVQPHLLRPCLDDAGARWVYLFTVDTPDGHVAARSRLLGEARGAPREDAATGSAAGPLGAYLVQYGLTRPGAFDIEQGVEMGRRSRITVEVPLESGIIGPVRVRGEVRIWGQGRLVAGEGASPKLKI